MFGCKKLLSLFCEVCVLGCFFGAAFKSLFSEGKIRLKKIEKGAKRQKKVRSNMPLTEPVTFKTKLQ